MYKILFYLITAVAVISSHHSLADAPFGQGLLPGIQYPDKDQSVYGLRASPGWAEHKEMYGLDLAWVGHSTTSHFAGIALAGGFNINHGHATVTGIQLAGLFNRNDKSSTIVGMQLAAGANVNKGKSTLVGIQLAA